MQSVKNVFPRPFKVLIKVVLTYKNGQIQARMKMNFPARGLWNTVSPMKRADTRNKTVHPLPSIIQTMLTLRVKVFSALELSLDCISATAGSSIVAMEFEIAEGNKMQGRAIPVSTP